MKASAAPILAIIVATAASVITPRAVNCNGDAFDLTVENWNKHRVDESIRAFWDEGKDAEGVDWPGADTYGSPRAFTTMLGTRLQNKGVWTCSGMPFDGRCDAEPCTEIGRYNKAGKMVDGPSRWGVFALNSVINLHRWLSDIWEGVDTGQKRANSIVFSAAKDFVKPDEKLNVGAKSILAGASFLLGLLGAVPATAVLTNVANPSVGLLSATLGIHLKSSTGERNFETADAFFRVIESFAQQTRDNLQEANSQILDSANDFALQIISGGAWVDAPRFDSNKKISANDVATFYRKNMISRGINALWKQYNVYVYYTWLNDAGAKPGDSKCDLDRSGPQDSKYCADDGVYYLYMYRAGRSGADYPYGGAKLAADPYNINPIWAVESSVRSFKAQGLNYDAEATDLSKLLGARGIDDYLNSPERLEGTWTLPVCDGSSRGRFNVDYTSQKDYDPKGGRGEPPCACGIDGRDTATFIRAANFDAEAAANKCLVSWTETKLDDWPAGVNRITYDEEGKHFVTKKAVENCIKNTHFNAAFGAARPRCSELN
ncbi:MAG: hypothetical protein Q9204_003536 [Flavoplaca sp. TL-2023a]